MLQIQTFPELSTAIPCGEFKFPTIWDHVFLTEFNLKTAPAPFSFKPATYRLPDPSTAMLLGFVILLLTLVMGITVKLLALNIKTLLDPELTTYTFPNPSTATSSGEAGVLLE